MGHFIIAAIAPYKVHLVLHQSNERGNNYGNAFTYHSGKLIAQTFASTSWHNYKRIVPGEQRFYDLFLVVFELIKTEVLPERFAKIKRMGIDSFSSIGRSILFGCLY